MSTIEEIINHLFFMHMSRRYSLKNPETEVDIDNRLNIIVINNTSYSMNQTNSDLNATN